MTAVATAAPVAAAPLTAGTARAQALGLPATLFGLTPDEPAYWREPGLPYLTLGMRTFQEPMPLDYRGQQAILCVGEMGGDNMAPRFPKGCSVQTAPVYEKSNLVVGRVYTYCHWNEQAEEWTWEIGRLLKIGGNYLEVKADNRPTPSLWLLNEAEPHKAVWDVREVTHYVYYPSEEEEAAGAGTTGAFLPWLPTPPPHLTAAQPDAAPALAA